ncbi:MAG TPA: glycosyltransferase [Kiloniellaceae bacterium]|nr:glycosyltransferase [Kiloniellaceae bacterium]
MHRDPRKVLFLPDWKRANPYQRLLAAALDENGYSVDFADYPGGRLPLYTLLKARRDVGVLHIHWIVPWIKPFFWTTNPAKRLAKLALLILDLRLCRMLGVRVFWTIHNLVTHESQDTKWELRLRRQIARQVNGCFVHSQSALTLLERAYDLPLAGKSRVVPHASYVGQYPPIAAAAVTSLRHDLGLQEGDFVYLFLGAIREYKGLGPLIAAFKSLPDPRARLVIAGAAFTPEIEGWLRGEAEGDRRIVLRVGYVSDADLSAYMTLASVVVLPFAQTLASGSTLLAMSFAKPLILPEAARIYDVPGDAGALYFRNGGLSGALMAAQQADLGAMGAHNQAQAQARSWSEMAALTGAAYARQAPARA